MKSFNLIQKIKKVTYIGKKCRDKIKLEEIIINNLDTFNRKILKIEK